LGRDGFRRRGRNGTTSYVYNSADLAYWVTAPNPGFGAGPAQTTKTYYNKMLQATNVVQPDGASLFTEYYPSGELKKTYGARTYPVEYTNDYAGRLKTMKTWTNYAGGQGAAVTTWNYDQYRGWLNNKRYPDGTGPDYEYTDAGRLKTRYWARTGTGGQRIKTTYTYGINDGTSGNDSGDLVSVAYFYDPQSTPGVSYAYDRLGRVTQLSTINYQLTSTYNLASALLKEEFTGGTLAGLSVTNGFDTLLRRTNLALLNPSSVLLASAVYSYDPASHLQTVSDGNNSVTYSYLANSPLVSQITFRQGEATQMTTTKQFDYLNRLRQISSVPSAVSFGYSYNSANQRTRSSLADNSYWRFGYDWLGQVTSGKKYWSDQTPVAGQQFEYAFDDIGNRT
jgi:hypothetical protein